MANLNLEEIHDTMVAVALDAGRMIISANPTDIDQGTKLNSNLLAAADIVTETDKAVEKLVSASLSQKYPTFAFVGEETYVPQTPLTDEPTFIVDPIDGTTNFVHAFPGACISAGLAVNKAPAIGVVYNPYTDVLFSAIRGRGAWMVKYVALLPPQGGLPAWKSHEANKHAQRLPLSKNVPALGALDSVLLAVEWGSSRGDDNFFLKVRTFEKLARDKTAPGGGAMTQGIRSLGSAALNLCAVAAGQLDVYWEGGCWAWDVCAGWCVLNEAGGVMYSGNPKEEVSLTGRAYLAVRAARGGSKEQEALRDEFWDVIGEGNLMKYEH